jgi:hypothetical protein
MDKIDFFGGLHGHYLELLANVFVYQNNYNVNQSLFTNNGSCHLKDTDPTYNKIIVAEHWSYDNQTFNPTDRVVRIVPTIDDMLIGITNSFYRAGDDVFDLHFLEKNTLAKLENLPKAEQFLQTIIKDLGTHDNYSRAAFRNYFYSMIAFEEYGLTTFTTFNDQVYESYNFSFRSFFDINQLYVSLNEMAKFLNLNFYPTADLYKLHEDFLSKNQGYASEIKCKHILNCVLSGQSYNLINLTLIEEAWINLQIAKIFRCFDLPLLSQDIYPTNTQDIANAVYNWKSADY